MTRTIFVWIQARRVLASVAAVFLLLLVSAAFTTAQTQISFGNSSQNVSFQATSATSMNIGLGTGALCASPGFVGSDCTLSGNAVFDDLGSYSFTTNTNGGTFTATNSGGTVFGINTPAGATSLFNFTGADGDNLMGSVNWVDVANGSANPHFDGILNITFVAGDAAFHSAFATPTATFDLILSSLTCSPAPVNGTGTVNGGCNLENLFNSNFTSVASAPISSGQMAQTPEPASLLLFGSGLLACGAFIRRRRSASVATA
jgi:PEP-CTERM motif